MPATSAVAREVVEAYGIDIGAHPVGTGPYLLREYQRSHRIVLEANPGYRKVMFDEPIPVNREDAAIARLLKGKQLPLDRPHRDLGHRGRAAALARVSQAGGRLPAAVSRSTSSRELLDDNGKLRPELAAKGIHHELLLRPNTWWTYFNMEDPVVGGYTPEKIALRRAIGMAFNTEEFIRVLYRGRAVPAQGPVPPDVAGYDPAHKTQAQLYDPAAARALLDRFGYKDRDGDGYRELPDGKPLMLERWSTPSSRDRQIDELWKKNMDAIGIRIVFKKDKLPEIAQDGAGRQDCRCAATAGTPTTPTPTTSCSCCTAPTSASPTTRVSSCPNSIDSTSSRENFPTHRSARKLYDRMTDLVIAYAPWKLTHHLLEDHVIQPWVVGYKPHPIRSDIWKYLDIDPGKRPK